jgi:hypothetical protein
VIETWGHLEAEATEAHVILQQIRKVDNAFRAVILHPFRIFQ